MEESLRKELQNIPRIRQEHFDSIYFYKNTQTGFCYIESNPYLPVQIKTKSNDLLQELYNGTWISPEDHGKIINLYDRIKQGIDKPIHMQELAVDLHLQIGDYPEKLYTLTC